VGSGGYFATSATATFQSLGNDGVFVPFSQGDGAVVTFVLPFSLLFYGTSYAAGSSLSISANGNLQFTSSGGSGAANNVALALAGTNSNPLITAPSLFVHWDDLTLDTPGGGVFLATLGTLGSRRLVVEWRGRRLADIGRPTNLFFQAVFFEDSTDFLLNYGQSGGANGATATVGSWRDNSNYTEWSVNSAVITPDLSLRFSLTDPRAAADIPEPTSLAMVLLAAAGGLALRWRRS